MRKIEDEETDIEIPGENDENVGDGAPKKKKRKKSKEERAAERKVVFWTLIIILIITLSFWMVPVIRDMFNGEPVTVETENKSQPSPTREKPEIKNYVEITL